MKTVCGITFDESKIKINAEEKARLKRFFALPEIPELVNDNKWEEIFDKWYRWSRLSCCRLLIKLLLLSEIDFLNYLKKIPSFIFLYCKLITAIKIPEGVNVIAREAFSNCSSLTSIVIPKSVIIIGGYVFYRCPSLKSINYLGTEDEWDSIEKDLDWAVESSIEKLICKDGEIKLNL